MVINSTTNIQPTRVVINKEKIDEDTGSDTVDNKTALQKEQPDFMKMASLVADWKMKKAITEEPVPGMGVEVACMLGGIALGFGIFCNTEGNPLGLLAGLLVGGTLGSLKCMHDIKESKEKAKLMEEVKSEQGVIEKYEKTLRDEEIRQEKFKAEEKKKHQEELQKQKEAKEAEIEKKKEEFQNLLKEDLNKFKETNDILFETGIISTAGWDVRACESYYNIGAADIIDVNQDGKANTSERPVASFRKEVHYKEPDLVLPYATIEKTARDMKKGIMTTDDIKGMDVDDFGVSFGSTGFQRDSEIQENERSIDLMAKNLMPDVPGVKGAIDIVNKRFVIYKPKTMDSYSI